MIRDKTSFHFLTTKGGEGKWKLEFQEGRRGIMERSSLINFISNSAFRSFRNIKRFLFVSSDKWWCFLSEMLSSWMEKYFETKILFKLFFTQYSSFKETWTDSFEDILCFSSGRTFTNQVAGLRSLKCIKSTNLTASIF